MVDHLLLNLQLEQEEPGRLGAVTACCQTLGPPNESKSIMGHLDKESFEKKCITENVMRI